jgi:hypothetical protein
MPRHDSGRALASFPSRARPHCSVQSGVPLYGRGDRSARLFLGTVDDFAALGQIEEGQIGFRGCQILNHKNLLSVLSTDLGGTDEKYPIKKDPPGNTRLEIWR